MHFKAMSSEYRFSTRPVCLAPHWNFKRLGFDRRIRTKSLRSHPSGIFSASCFVYRGQVRHLGIKLLCSADREIEVSMINVRAETVQCSKVLAGKERVWILTSEDHGISSRRRWLVCCASSGIRSQSISSECNL